MPPVVVTKDRVDEVLKLIRLMTKSEVLIGIPAEASGRPPDPKGGLSPNNAVIGYLNEFGDPEKNIPPRPHLVPGVESILPRAIPILKKSGEAALSGNKRAVDDGFMKVGLLGEGAVRGKITDGPFVKLSPRTLAARRERGVTRESPLIDTGLYRRAVTYVVRVRGQ